MKILSETVFTGPSIFGNRPVIRCRLDVGSAEDWPIERLRPVVFDVVFEYFPALREDYALPDGGKQSDLSLARVFMFVALELQNSVCSDRLEVGEVHPASSAGVYDVTYGYEDEKTGLAAGRLALALIRHLLKSEPQPPNQGRPDVDFTRARKRFVRFARPRALSIEHKYIAKAAAARDIPWVHLGGGLVLYGQGRYQKRRLKHFSDQTSHISFVVSSDKRTTNSMLGELGLPVPKQRVIRTVKEAVSAAGAIGYPVVVKPLNSDFGRGVGVGLTDAEKVSAAFHNARRYGRAVIVESHIDGDDHRLLVLGGKVIAAAKRIPAHVVGDGTHTVEELMEEVNRDPRRGPKGLKWLRHLEFDEEAKHMLADVGYTSKSVPGRGETIYFRSASNLSAGGTSIDVTDRVHPDNRQMAIWAAKAADIDLAGIDFITTDISRSYKDVGGGICEVNTTPALSPHATADDRQRDVATPIIDALYPSGAASRIPIAVITGSTGRADTARVLAHILTQAGHTVGHSTSAGVYIDGALTAGGDLSGPAAARMVLRNPTVDAAILEMSSGELLRHGLGFDGCDVAAVLNVTADPTDGDSADGSEDAVEAMSVVVKATRDTVVINADDKLCLGMAAHAEPGRILLATETEDSKQVKAHLRQGLRGAVLRSNSRVKEITIYHKGDQDPVIQIDKALILGEDSKSDHLQGAMFAVAMASALGHSADYIQAALNSLP